MLAGGQLARAPGGLRKRGIKWIVRTQPDGRDGRLGRVLDLLLDLVL